MNEVSCRALDLVFRKTAELGVRPEALLEGVDYDLEHLRDSNERVDWSAYVKILGNTARHCTDDDFVSMGGMLVKSPIFKTFGLFARLLFTATDFYRWLNTPRVGGGNQLFACVDSDYQEHGKGHCEIKLMVRPEYEAVREFFVQSLGGLQAMPVMLGLPPANVQMKLEGNTATYTLRFDPGRTLFVRLKRFFLWPLLARETARELKEAHESLQSRFLELDTTRGQLSRQATQLQTAHTISQVVHSELDLSRTMEAVAHAFTEIAGFAASYVVVDGPPTREAWSGPVDASPHLSRTMEAGGEPIGRIALWFAEGAETSEREELVATVLPTVAMALHGARAYASLLDAQKHLELRVQQRTSELSAARDALAETVTQLETAEATRARLFANVNHEIRTPLTLILLSVDELQREVGQTPVRERTLAAVSRNARKLLRLVDGLLLLAAGEEGQLTISPRKIDVSALVSEVIDSFAAAARTWSVTLRDSRPATLFAEVEEAAIERILANLVSNALKFTPAGGEVVVGLVAHDDELELLVRDNGIGITDEFLGRAFGRFEQDRRPVRPGNAGSGIGLSLVRDLAQAHCGRAEVERLEQGTLFRVVLPRVTAPGVKRAPTEHRPRRGTPSDFGLPSGEPAVQPELRLAQQREHTVLVVEDDEELRVRLIDILSGRYHVLAAGDAERGLEIAAQQRPDLLVTDIGLPGIDGLELTRRFQDMPGNRLAPALVLSAYVSLDDRLSGFEAGAVDYLTKPFDPAELVARVQAQLDRRALALRLHDSEKLAAIGTMTAGLAHEMRNPANALVNAVEPLIELLPKELREPGSPVADLLSIIRDCSAQMGLLSRQLLGFRRGVEVAREDTPAVALMERAIAILKPALRDVEVRVALGYRESVYCAPVLILQVLSNLLDNAAHAAASTREATKRPWVRIHTFEVDGRFVCEVSDSGPGVPVALRDRIFEPFFTTKPPGEGSGLGLSTSRQIAERHNGTLSVRAIERGSVFRLELPTFDTGAVGAISAG